MNFEAFKDFIYKDEVLELLKKYLEDGVFDEEKANTLGYEIYNTMHITYAFHILQDIKMKLIEDNFGSIDKNTYRKIEEFFEKLQNAMTIGYGRNCVQSLDYLEDELYAENHHLEVIRPSYEFKFKLSMDFMTGKPQNLISQDPTSCEVYDILERLNIPPYLKQNVHMAHNRLHELVKYFYKLLEGKDVSNTYSIYWRMRYLNLLIVTAISLYSMKEQDEIISETLKLQERLSKFNRLLGEINQYINFIEDEKELFQKICDLTVAFTEAKLAWIGKPDETGRIQFLAKFGAVDFIENLFISINPDIPEGRGPSGIAWREKKIVFISDVFDSEQTKPWREKAGKFGIGEVATIPILKNNESYAIFNFYLPEEESFDNELKKTLEEIGKDISYGVERIELLRREKELNEFNKALVNSSTSGIIIGKYPERSIEYANKRFVQMLGYNDEKELIGKNGKEIFPSDEVFVETYNTIVEEVIENGYGKAKDVALKRKDGSIIHVDLSGVKLSDNPTRVVWTFVDVEDRYQLEQELERQAIKDALTGLHNRRALEKELERAFRRTKRSKKLLAVCMLDLDGFKPVNDTYGHDAGDEVLKVIADRLISAVRNTDFVARLGGDEFVVLLEDLNAKDEIYPILERIEHIIKTPIGLSDRNIVSVGTSIGVAIYDPNNDDIDNEEKLIRLADKVLYESKAHKQDRLSSYTIYGEKIKTKATKSQELLYKGLVEVFYQPILDLRESKIVGLEALARLKNEDGKILSPAVFLPELSPEDLYLLSSIMMDKTLKDLKELDKLGYPLWVSVNVDPRNLNESYLSSIKEHMIRESVSPHRVILELLESSNFEEQEIAFEHIFNLKSVGVQVALDDVGSAYSSLMRIKDLPIDEIKLDQAFVRSLEKNPKDLFFVHAIGVLAENLNINLVVEGVETKDILDALMVLGIRMVQGYFIAKPMPFEALKEFLKENYNFPMPKEYPETLLGVYAQSIIHNSHIKSLIDQEINVINYNTLASHTECAIYKSLEKVLPYRDYTLEALHRKYHLMLAKAIENMIAKQKPIKWDVLDKMYMAFQNYILDIYKRSKNESK